jgi:hypothetical protein
MQAKSQRLLIVRFFGEDGRTSALHARGLRRLRPHKSSSFSAWSLAQIFGSEQGRIAPLIRERFPQLFSKSFKSSRIGQSVTRSVLARLRTWLTGSIGIQWQTTRKVLNKGARFKRDWVYRYSARKTQNKRAAASSSAAAPYGLSLNQLTSLSRPQQTPSACGSGSGAAACAAPWLRSAGCVRVSPGSSDRLLPACAPNRLQDRSAS